ncbi:MAG: hypothetical protein GYB31_06765 [Bacteroidetes bacterium]|nr:hypothetical protein [Bacteroidota bacterium]
MRKYTALYIVSLAMVLLPACNKIELPPDAPGTEAAYYISWNDESGNLQEWEAGIDGYRLSSESMLEGDSLYLLSGRFEETDCFDLCGPSLEIRLSDLAVYDGGDFAFLPPGSSYPFRGIIVTTDADTTISWALTLNAESTGQAGTEFVHTWTLDNAITYPDMESVVHQTASPLPIEVCLHTVVNPNQFGCNSTQCQTISPLPADPQPLRVYIKDVSPLNDSLLAEVSGVAAPVTYFWSTGETTQSISASNPGVYEVLVSDNSGNTSSASVEIGQGPAGMNICSADFSIEREEVLDITPGDTIPGIAFGTVEIILEVDGEVFTSRGGIQNPNNYFILDNISSDPENPDGKKVELRFQADLYSENGGEVRRLSGGEAVVFLKE